MSGLSYDTLYSGQGGTQTAGGTGGIWTSSIPSGNYPLYGGGSSTFGDAGGSGGFGIGGNNNYGPYGSGGGGGWYGGGAGEVSGSGTTQQGTNTPGGVGSSYIGGVQNGTTTAGTQSMPSPNGGAETGQSGNGYARITLIQLADTAPPVTTDNAPTGWINKDVTVNLTATDNDGGSGVAATHYTIDNGSQQTGTSVNVTGEGVRTITYWSVDKAGNVEAQHNATVKIDKTAPALNISLDKNTLSPANHKMVPVTATINVSDDTSGIESVVLTSITSNETLQPDDIQNANYNTPITGSTDSFELRAERLASGNGRVYTITFTATDKAGNVTTKSVNITVPHDQSNK